MYRQLIRLEKKIEKLRSSPHLTSALCDRLASDVRLSVYLDESSKEDDYQHSNEPRGLYQSIEPPNHDQKQYSGASKEEDDDFNQPSRLTNSEVHPNINQDQDIDNESNEQNVENTNIDYDDDMDSNIFCDNCLRKQNQKLISKFGEQYRLHFFEQSKRDIRKFRKFKYSPRYHDEEFYLCQECNSFLVTEDDKKIAKSAKNMWPSFIISTLCSEEVVSLYGNKAWQLIPHCWRYWWVDTLPGNSNGYENISMDFPVPIIIDRTCELTDWKNKIGSNILPRMSEACNKHMIPTVMCPWGCNEFIFR